MAKVYRPYFPEQDFLLPPSLREWLPEGHLAHFVSDLIDQLDLSQIEEHYEREERGYPPYHPHMMTKVLVYGYCVGVFSSRRLEKRLSEDIAFRVLAASNEPDFRCLSPPSARITAPAGGKDPPSLTTSPGKLHAPRRCPHAPNGIIHIQSPLCAARSRHTWPALCPGAHAVCETSYNTVALGTRCNSGDRGVFSRDLRFLRFTIRLKSGSCWC